MLAANRDEMRDRPWSAPGRHWPDRPEVFAGIDLLAGGSWLGLNDHGVVAAILNRRNSLGPAPGLRSRGELVLDALDHADAEEAARALSALDPRAYRSFNLIVADQDRAYWIRSLGPDGPPRSEAVAVPPGLSMITAADLNDAADPRIARHLPRWRATEAPRPERGDWSPWENLLASRDGGADGRGAMTFQLTSGFGTVSSTLIALPDARRAREDRPVFRFAEGHPDAIAWRDLSPDPAGVATLPTRTL
jgi:hypothetical protein